MKWDPIIRESEQQIIEMIWMCDENHMANVFKQDMPTFKDKFIELAVPVKGEVREKLRNFMRSEKYREILIERVEKGITGGPKGQKVPINEWPQPDAAELSKLRKEVEEYELTDPIWFYQHRVRCDWVTHKTKSGRVCYWCISTQCFTNRMNAHVKENKNPAEKETTDKKKWRQNLDFATRYMCNNYMKKREEQKKKNTKNYTTCTNKSCNH